MRPLDQNYIDDRNELKLPCNEMETIIGDRVN